MTRLSACDSFMNLDSAVRARVIETAQGCTLCLDWTRDHKANNCTAQTKQKEPFQNCRVKSGNQVCGKQHNSLLHGLNNHYCNNHSLISNHASEKLPTAPAIATVAAKDNASLEKFERAPTKMEIDAVGAAHSLMLMQITGIRSEKLKNVVVFWDTGSNVNMIRRAFAEEAG